jgi:ketosteroid isomerase-like protein
MSSQSPPQLFADAISGLHAAMAKVANGDISAIKALYAHGDDATSFYGWGGYEKGWEAVSRRWDWAGRQFKGGTVSYQNVTTVVTAELAYTTDIETFKVKMEGMDQATQWSNRVTHIFRLAQGAWRLVHRHANRLETQYEPSTRLAPGRST